MKKYSRYVVTVVLGSNYQNRSFRQLDEAADYLKRQSETCLLTFLSAQEGSSYRTLLVGENGKVNKFKEPQPVKAIAAGKKNLSLWDVIKNAFHR